MKILYITFIDMDKDPASGSGVRPQRMLEAFRELGYEVKLLEGIGNDRGKREKGTAEIRRWLKTQRPDLCYIEPPSGPLFFHCDRSLIRYIKSLGIPVGLFYRDAYWKFPEFATGAKKSLKDRCKGWLIRRMQIRDAALFERCCSVVYFPSQTMLAHFSFPRMEILPPGCFHALRTRRVRREGEVCTGIFVGGATVRYGMGLLLEAAARLNREKVRLHLTVVCAEQGWTTFLAQNPVYREAAEAPWLEVHHLHAGPELEELYARSDFGIIPVLRNIYNDFGVPIKLFEYLSHLLPIVATDCTEIARLVEGQGIGIVAHDRPEDFERALGAMIDRIDSGCYDELCRQAMEDNLWTRRARQIVSDLTQAPKTAENE